MSTTPRASDISKLLEAVPDPELGSNIVDLGMVGDITISDGTVTIPIKLTIASCPLRGEIRDAVTERINGIPGVDKVKVVTTEMTQEERSALMDRARRAAADRAPDTEIPPTTRVIAVASGKGGVGKSSVTANLAAAVARSGHVVGVLDADIWGFSIPRLLGASDRLGGEDGKIDPIEIPITTVAPASSGSATNDPPAGMIKMVSMGSLVEEEDKALMWRGLILAKAVEQFLTDVRWGELDYLFIDMPPGTGDIQMALSRLLPRAELIVVTTPPKNAQRVASRVADMARRSYLKVIGVVENMSSLICAHGERIDVFGSGGGQALADSLGVPLLGSIPLEPSVSIDGDEGTPVVLGHPDSIAAARFEAIADRIIDEIAPIRSMEGCTARMLAAIENSPS